VSVAVVGSLVVGVGGGCVFRFSFLMVHALERWKVLVLVKRVLQLTKCYPINLQTFTYHEYPIHTRYFQISESFSCIIMKGVIHFMRHRSK